MSTPALFARRGASSKWAATVWLEDGQKFWTVSLLIENDTVREIFHLRVVEWQ